MRRARPDEARAVGALVEAAFAQHVEAVGRRPAPMDDDHAAHIAAGEQWVSDDPDGVAGLASAIVLTAHDDHLHVDNVAVAPALHGRGLGRALLAFADDEARRRGLGEVRLYTNAAMSDNLIFYPKLGFVEAARYEQHGFSRVLFVKRV
ncbi:MAG TPA: GNAT family N-acetyltransferase [Baekduia sp.]|uniref:GNAT family N-acetyltransferase n=1 Tax=Baekduia sp. TaxID=2600305 RepID=UPI002D77C1FB|nr:GNAT family N-acetyltransferase [Baekduia sp.]HET6507432.1 GNAT family N-acetyltransferase [Baekduia sp.]